jgi:Spy/CpxP family protein refolding chaperone
MEIRRPTRSSIATAVLGLTLLSVAPLAAQARGRGDRPPSPERAAARLTRQLDLTEEQQEQVQAVLETSIQQHQELREQHRLEQDTLRDATEDQLAEVLTGEQMERLRDLRDARRDGRRDGDCRKGPWEGGPAGVD